VETLGDNVYMVAGGVPDRRCDHAESMAAVALEFRTKVKQINVPDTERILIRIGNSTYFTSPGWKLLAKRSNMVRVSRVWVMNRVRVRVIC